MFGLGKSKNLVGLDIGSSAVKAVELRRKGNSFELLNLGIEPLGQDTVVDGAIMDALSVSSAIEKIFTDNRIKIKNVATSVSGHSVIVKRVTVGATTDEELYNAIPYEAQQHIPFDMTDVNLSYQGLGPSPSGSGTDVMLVAVKREKILNHTNVLSQAGKTPIVVDYDGFAVYNAFEVNYEVPSDQMAALLNIGASIMNIVIGRGGNPLFTRDVSVGGNQYTDTLQKELDLSYEDAERLKQGFEVPNVTQEQKIPHLRSVTEILMLEIQKTFDFFRQTTSTENIQHIYVSGGTAKIDGLVDQLKAEFSIPVEIINPFQRIMVDSKKFDVGYVEEIAPRMSVAVGLALRSFD
ncbi:MAG: type IV pilus assembly protein PilM [Acidobacteriota bacterium]|nr:type IV pilus assembly protein PilM [Acidobacteriota bacterium]